MSNSPEPWRALSIRQPWVDMILAGWKKIEVREWRRPPEFRGRFLLHASYGIDWKTLALLNAPAEFRHPRGALVGTASLVDVIELSPRDTWRDLALEHRVIHPPNMGRTVYGLVLEDARAIERPIRAAGGPGLYWLSGPARGRIEEQLGAAS